MTDRKNFNRKVIEYFRAGRDKGEIPLEGRPLILLTTTGAKSGKQHTTPVRIFCDGDKPFITAFNAGAPSNPQWYANLLAHPEVTVETPRETFKAKAVVAIGAERDRLWANANKTESGFAEYQTKTARQIPVIKLERLKG